MRQGLAAYEPSGQNLRPYYLALLAEAYGKAGQTEEGLTCWPRRWLRWTKLGSVFYEAELYRLKGELTLSSPGKSKVQSPRQSRQV